MFFFVSHRRHVTPNRLVGSRRRTLVHALHIGVLLSGTLLAAPASAEVTRGNRRSMDERLLDAREDVQRRPRDLRQEVKDAVLNGRIRAALLKSLRGADGLRVDVQSTRGAVTLTGEVKDRPSQRLAVEVARVVCGVTTVQNFLKLNPRVRNQESQAARLQDAALQTDVKLRLLDAVGDSALKIHVEATSGVVSLRGPVTDEVVSKRAAISAAGAPGVTRVENLMDVAAGDDAQPE